MGNRSNDAIKAMLAKEMISIYSRSEEISKSINEELQLSLNYLQGLIEQIPQSKFGPLIAKTPKLTRKRGAQHIQTIPENDVVDLLPEKRESSVASSRMTRRTSKRTLDNIKTQPSDEENNRSNRQAKRTSRSKRKKAVLGSSDEEDQIPLKHSKILEELPSEDIVHKTIPADRLSQLPTNKSPKPQEPQDGTMTTRKSNRMSSTESKSSQHRIDNKSKLSNPIDDTLVAPMTDEIEEPSMYEDAIGKAVPIMNSTMNLNSTRTLHKVMNATVVLEPIQMMKLNETVTIKKMGNSAESVTRKLSVPKDAESKSPASTKTTSHSRTALQDRMQQIKKAMANKEFDALITDDESSPDIKKHKANKNQEQEEKKLKRYVIQSLSSEDEVPNTPLQKKKQVNPATAQEIKTTYKSNALFSPYAKESVKKRVEAFEQAGFNSPNPTTETQAPRMTRTKTRALAAAQADASEHEKSMEKTIAQKLARKSIAKAMKISLAKQIKDTDEYKENKVQTLQKNQRIIANEKLTQKRQQLKTTPLGKTKIQLPMSVNRLQHTPLHQPTLNNIKAQSATRLNNIVTAVDSYLQTTRVISSATSTEKLIDERKRKLNDEDARKKREEALRLLTDEKRRKRQEKELKNKLAREAKERQDMEKRQKAEKEREEKARLAQQMLDKQREEMEKKRLAQLQRAQEIEERRKQEEQQRQQRLQELEEAERLLAEQRRREQEAEKRKEAETVKLKNQILAAQTKLAHNKDQGPTNYILDSEPDEDESDDESRPKHAVPHWALSHVRKNLLAMQRYIPKEIIYKFFDTQKCTPNLSQMFHGIDRSRLKRTSSAIWKTPPRYSIMQLE